MSQDEDPTKKLQGSRRPPFVPPVVHPDTLVVPPNTIYLVPDQLEFLNSHHFEKCGSKRAWFTSYFYNCLPIVFGSQHGFILRATNSFVCRWNGTDANDGVSVHQLDGYKRDDLTVSSHFGHGILTVQSRHYFRTPKGVNMMVKAPPNYPVHGFSWMDAVVETDNLRRDFTYNIKITRPHMDIYIEKGTPVGCIVPYPRFFLDKYELVNLTDPEQLDIAVETANNYAIEREEYDGEKPRLRYREGRDIYDHFYDEHQKSLDSGQWWHSADAKVERKKMMQEEPARPPSQAAAMKCPVTQQSHAAEQQQEPAPQSEQDKGGHDSPQVMKCPVTGKQVESQEEKKDEDA
ncbi:MAG: hypothetical protein HYX67_08310 [Candidatus Melainabacteria bacterium]|nr:hypothetical protein [Candidatus Melainabacteria bacterium]